MFYAEMVTVPAASITANDVGAARRPADVPRGRRSPAVPLSLEDDWSGGPPFRLVLPRDKRDRLAQRAAALTRRRECSVLDCRAEGMPVLLVDLELEAILCPVHQLVLLDGSAVEGQPMLVTAAW